MISGVKSCGPAFLLPKVHFPRVRWKKGNLAFNLSGRYDLRYAAGDTTGKRVSPFISEAISEFLACHDNVPAPDFISTYHIVLHDSPVFRNFAPTRQTEFVVKTVLRKRCSWIRTNFLGKEWIRATSMIFRRANYEDCCRLSLKQHNFLREMGNGSLQMASIIFYSSFISYYPANI